MVASRSAVDATKTWVAGSGMVITEMHTEDISLEDVFVHFTGRPLGDETKNNQEA